MEKEMTAFPSIELSRKVLPNIVKDAQFTHYDRKWGKACYNENAQLPHLEFRGTVKLHGQNAAIVQTLSLDNRSTLHFQSRQRVLNPEQDLNGFHAHMSRQLQAIDSMLCYIRGQLKFSVANKQLAKIAIFGEWCGENIQKGVALSKLKKMFVIFAIKVEYRDYPTHLVPRPDLGTPAAWLDISSEQAIEAFRNDEARIFNIYQFGTCSVMINFNKKGSVEEAQKRIETLTQQVENLCPAGKFWGEEGIGEGLVWQVVKALPPLAHKYERYTQSAFWFKSKGEQHAKVGQKKPKLKIANVSDPVRMEKIKQFLELVLTPGRLEQGLQVIEREKMLPLVMGSFGAFEQWINGDVRKEENDRMEALGLEEKDVKRLITVAARAWFVERLEKEKIRSGREKLFQKFDHYEVQRLAREEKQKAIGAELPSLDNEMQAPKLENGK